MFCFCIYVSGLPFEILGTVELSVCISPLHLSLFFFSGTAVKAICRLQNSKADVFIFVASLACDFLSGLKLPCSDDDDDASRPIHQLNVLLSKRGSLRNLFQTVGAWLSMTVVGLIVILFVVFQIAIKTFALFHHSVFDYICVSLWCFTDIIA